jgi:hypothetical protein
MLARVYKIEGYEEEFNAQVPPETQGISRAHDGT